MRTGRTVDGCRRDGGWSRSHDAVMGESFKEGARIRLGRDPPMSQDRVQTDFLGHKSDVQYSPTWAGYALVSMRVALGWVFFDAGVTRLTDPTWSAANLFLSVPAGNPLTGLWTAVGHSLSWLLGPVVVWGLTVVGAALIFGAAVRLSAAVGASIMALLWATSLPLGNSLYVDQHTVYAFVLFGLCTFGAGRIAGLDAYFESASVVARHPWLRWLLG